VYSQSLSGPVDPSFRALSGRLQFTVRRHSFNEDPLSLGSVALSAGSESVLEYQLVVDQYRELSASIGLQYDDYRSLLVRGAGV